METHCPKCSQRLRVSDQLRNPLLRCPNCRETFRLGLDERLNRYGENRSESSPSGPVRSSGSLPSTEFPSIPTWNDRSQEKATAGASAEARLPDTTAEGEYQEFVGNLPQPRVPTAKPSHQWGAGIAGWVIAIVVFLLLNGGPRIAKQFLGKRQHKNEPAQMKEKQRQAIDQAIRDMEREIAKDRAKRGRHPMGVPQPPSERGPTD